MPVTTPRVWTILDCPSSSRESETTALDDEINLLFSYYSNHWYDYVGKSQLLLTILIDARTTNHNVNDILRPFNDLKPSRLPYYQSTLRAYFTRVSHSTEPHYHPVTSTVLSLALI